MSSKDPDWLPDRLCFDDHEGDMDSFLDVIFEFFEADFIDSRPNPFRGKPFGLKREEPIEGREATFWHLVTEEDENRNRGVELPRCERIRWPRPIIDQHEQRELRCWKQKRKGDKRWAIALDGFSYVVILAERRSYILPWTAFPVEREHRRLKLYREYLEYQEEIQDP